MPIHLIWGDDITSIERSIEALINKVIDPGWSSINFSKLDGSDINQAKQALEEIRTPPLGNGGRVVLLKRNPYCNNCPEELTKMFEEVIQVIPNNSHLILSNVNKPDGRLKTTKALQRLIKSDKAFERSFLLPAFWDVNGQKNFINCIAKEMGLLLDSDATLLLVEAIGNDSERLASELSKLSLLAQSQNVKPSQAEPYLPISAKLVNSLIDGITSNALQVGESLLRGEKAEAIQRIDALLNAGEPPLRIISTLSGQVRGWLWVSLLDKQGEKDVSVIAKAAGIANPKRIYVMRKQLQGRPPQKFLNLLNRLLEVEADIKRGIMAKDAFRDYLIADKE